MKRFSQILALALASALLLVSCKPSGGGDQESNRAPLDSSKPGNLMESETFPMFNNTIDHTRGEISSSPESYLDYSVQRGFRHTFKDMEYHEAELAAVELAEAGVFEKTASFEPDQTMTVRQFVKAILQLARQADTGTSEADVEKLAKSTQLVEGGQTLDFGAVLTREWMAYLLDRACVDRENAEQYQLLLEDYDQIDKNRQASVLQCLGLGLILSDKTFRPTQEVTRAEAAQALYRLVTPGMRLVAPYELGDAYQSGESTYVVKNTYQTNKSGLQLGFWSNYNQQSFTFSKFGKRPIDRTDFHKWVNCEKTKGNYTFGFGNDQDAHKMGSTVITNIDISANLIWNPYFQKSNIPSFYAQDITDPVTRQAAKSFLYSFVQALLESVKGDVLLAIDYELDWQQNISGIDEDSRRRAAIWAQWYVEACQVARDAAQHMGADGRLKLILIYNNITDMHKLGPGQNAWMMECAKASDVVGIDIYFHPNATDRTDPAMVLQNIRYLINNYSLGKPVMVVENGVALSDEVTEDMQAQYFKNLFREFQFALGKGDFLNLNLSALLFWNLKDDGGGFGVFAQDGTPRPAAQVIREGIAALESTRLYNPSVLKSTQNVIQMSSIPIEVKSGTTYDQLTLITTTTAGEKTFRIKLANPGTVFITVNGQYHYASTGMNSRHVISIPEGITDGVNKIEIFFGSEKTPFTQTVEAIDFK